MNTADELSTGEKVSSTWSSRGQVDALCATASGQGHSSVGGGGLGEPNSWTDTDVSSRPCGTRMRYVTDLMPPAGSSREVAEALTVTAASEPFFGLSTSSTTTPWSGTGFFTLRAWQAAGVWQEAVGRGRRQMKRTVRTDGQQACI